MLAGLNKALDMAEKDYQGPVVGNQGATFQLAPILG